MIAYLIVFFTLQVVGVSSSCRYNAAFQDLHGHKVSCFSTHADDCNAIALCLLRVNQISKFLNCGDYEANTVLTWDLDSIKDVDSDYLEVADGCDFIPSDDKNFEKAAKDNDSLFKLTPRGLLLQAAWDCPTTYCKADMYDLISYCPYDDMKSFIKCLCWYQMKPDDLIRLNAYIWRYSYGAQRLDEIYDMKCLDPDRRYLPEHHSSSRSEEAETYDCRLNETLAGTQDCLQGSDHVVLNARGSSGSFITPTGTPLRGTAYTVTSSFTPPSTTDDVNESGYFPTITGTNTDMAASTITISPTTDSTASASGDVSSGGSRGELALSALTLPFVVMVATILC